MELMARLDIHLIIPIILCPFASLASCNAVSMCQSTPSLIDRELENGQWALRETHIRFPLLSKCFFQAPFPVKWNKLQLYTGIMQYRFCLDARIGLCERIRDFFVYQCFVIVKPIHIIGLSMNWSTTTVRNKCFCPLHVEVSMHVVVHIPSAKR